MIDLSKLPPVPKESKFKQALGLGVGIWDYFDEKEKELGDTYTLTFPGQGPMIWTSDPKMIVDIIKLQRHQIDGSKVQLPFDLGEQNLVFSNNEQHHDARKLLIPQFAGNLLKNRARMMYEITNEHINSWKVGDTFDAPRLVGDITMDITCATLFNLRHGERKERYKELMLGWIMEANSNINFTLASLVGATRFRRFLNRQYMKRSEKRKMGTGKKGLLPWKRSVDLKVQLAAMLREDIEDIRARMDESESHTLSYLARTRDADGNLLPMEKVISEVYGLMIGGHETSAATASWLMIWLQQRPDIYRRMREELLAFIEKAGCHDPLLASELPFITACLNESQRITPSAPGYVRWLTEETRIGDWTIPAGVAVLPNIYATHRRKDIYGEDALEFNPDRWLLDSGGTRAFKPYEFMPFGGGRRACVGMSQARQQLRVIFSEFARRVEFSSAFEGTSSLPTSRLIGGQVEPRDGVPVRVREVRPQNYGYSESATAPDPVPMEKAS
ncbi:MAG: cytochrome P450 [Ketobacteraceae bacterium]|nr:cytochrome P450 [Ketobacteraceae bacterium]